MEKRAKPATIISASVGIASYLLARGLDMAGVTLSLGWAVVLWVISGIFLLVAIVVGFRAYVWPTLRTIRIVRGEGEKTNAQPSLSSEVRLGKKQLVINAITEAEKITPDGKDVTVYITDDNGLKKMFYQELKDILVKLQDEKMLKLKTFPNWSLPSEKFTTEVFEATIRAKLEPSRNHFTVQLLKDLSKPDKGDSRT